MWVIWTLARIIQSPFMKRRTSMDWLPMACAFHKDKLPEPFAPQPGQPTCLASILPVLALLHISGPNNPIKEAVPLNCSCPLPRVPCPWWSDYCWSATTGRLCKLLLRKVASGRWEIFPQSAMIWSATNRTQKHIELKKNFRGFQRSRTELNP